MSVTGLRIGTAAIVTAVLGLVIAGPATAEVWTNGRDGAQLSSQGSYPDAVDRAVANHKTHVLAPDDRIRVRGSEASYPDAVGRAVANHKADLRRTAQSSTVAQPGDGFDWGAAGVGASTTAALLLALGIGIGMSRRTRSAAA